MKLSESTDGKARIKLLEDAIYNYQTAQALKELEAAIISFRLGLAYNALSMELQDDSNSMAIDLTRFAVEEFKFILNENISFAAMDIGSTFYILPFHALFHRAISFLIRGDIKNSKKDCEDLLALIDKSDDMTKFPNIAKELKQNTIAGLERWVN